MLDVGEHGPMRYVALLRGVTPTNRQMRNVNLRRVVESLGYTDVATVITTGNVVFSSSSRSTAKLEEALEAAWRTELGFASTTVVRSRTQLHELIDADPFAAAATDERGWQATFLKHRPSELLDVPFVPDGFPQMTVVRSDHLTVCTALELDGGGGPAAMGWLERRYGPAITTRTWKTVTRVVAAMS